jgi:hypothetical protein
MPPFWFAYGLLALLNPIIDFFTFAQFSPLFLLLLGAGLLLNAISAWLSSSGSITFSYFLLLFFLFWTSCSPSSSSSTKLSEYVAGAIAAFFSI